MFSNPIWLASCNLYELGVGKNLFQQRFKSPGAVKEKAGESASLKIKTDEWLTEHHIKTLCAKNFFKAGDCVKILNFHVAAFWKATWQYPNFLMLS